MKLLFLYYSGNLYGKGLVFSLIQLLVGAAPSKNKIQSQQQVSSFISLLLLKKYVHKVHFISKSLFEGSLERRERKEA